MRRFLLSILTLLALSLPAFCRVAERVYVTTDRDVYVAGDRVWCSVFCLTGEKTLSPVSAVAYLELHSSEGMVQTAKIALTGGRGAGSFTLPGTLPTGNYRLVAYTYLNAREVEETTLPSRIISVFNVLSKDRVKDGVEIVSEEKYSRPSPAGGVSCGQVKITPGIPKPYSAYDGRILVRLENMGAMPVSLSVSVYHEDGLRHPDNQGAYEFAVGLAASGEPEYENGTVAEYEGEIVRGHIAGVPASALPDYAGKYAFISTPSSRYDIYASPIDSDGRVEFHTGNIYGNCDLVCEIAGLDSSMTGYLELDSPFVDAYVPAIPQLEISSSAASALKARSAAMQIERRFAADTLYSWLPLRDNALLSSEKVGYILDDYTRFPSMKELFTEFVFQIKPVISRRSAPRLAVATGNYHHKYTFSDESSLILLDGVPVFDHKKIIDYDPLLVKEINVYPYRVFIGDLAYYGVADFVTYKGNMPSFSFGGSVRVAGFQGVSFPQAYTGESIRVFGDYPDYRQTIYWNPLTEIPADGSIVAAVKVPDYEGEFTVIVEGFDSTGAPVCAKSSFSVK